MPEGNGCGIQGLSNLKSWVWEVAGAVDGQCRIRVYNPLSPYVISPVKPSGGEGGTLTRGLTERAQMAVGLLHYVPI